MRQFNVLPKTTTIHIKKLFIQTIKEIITIPFHPSNMSHYDQGSSKRQSSSSYTGVSFRKTESKWQSRLWHRKRFIYLGIFDSEQDAARAFDCAVLHVRGAGAHTNFSPDGYSEKDRADMVAFLTQKVCP
jgi:hypothetical protein